MNQEHRKCAICSKRFKVQEWKVCYERAFCVTCQCFIKVVFEKKLITPRMRKIIEMRFGYEDGITHDRGIIIC